jgi:neutral trehalase
VPSVQRPTDDEGLRMLVLAQLGRRYGFELRRMPRDRAVLIQDLSFNAILVAANRSLARLAAYAGIDVPDGLQRSWTRTPAALEELWDEDAGQYFSRDAVTRALIRLPTVATFLPLFAGAVEFERAERLVGQLRAPGGFWPRFPVPTVPTDAAWFREEAYWKGPTWVNMNWFVIEGLAACHADDIATALLESTLRLVDGNGFSEYFSPLTGHGYGASEFSWTAALTLDLIARYRARRGVP